MNDIYLRLKQVNLFVQIGYSRHDHPAAGFVDIARTIGLATPALNLQLLGNAAGFNDSRLGKASEIVLARVDEALGR